MPAGMRGARAVMDAREEEIQRGNRIFNMVVGNGEVAVLRSLSSGGPDDKHFGMAQVLEHVWQEDGKRRYEWEPAPGAFDDPEGKYRGTLPRTGPGSWRTGMKAGLFVWCYKLLRVTQREDDWRQVVLSESWLEEMYGTGNAQRDAWGGVRYVQPMSRVLLWLRGPGFGQEFVRGLERLTRESENRNLTGHTLAVGRWDLPGKGDQPPRPQWTYAIVDPSWNRRAAEWPELHYTPSEEERTEQRRYYEALPHIREVFEGTMRWPLFDEEGDSEPVPPQARQEPMQQPEPPTDEERQAYVDRIADGASEPPQIPPMEQPPAEPPEGLSEFLD